ncbi:hypothetical protein PG989_012200 [Apiospora arundinis]
MTQVRISSSAIPLTLFVALLFTFHLLCFYMIRTHPGIRVIVRNKRVLQDLSDLKHRLEIAIEAQEMEMEIGVSKTMLRPPDQPNAPTSGARVLQIIKGVQSGFRRRRPAGSNADPVSMQDGDTEARLKQLHEILNEIKALDIPQSDADVRYLVWYEKSISKLSTKVDAFVRR